MILNDAYDLTKTKACLFFRYFYDGVFIWILRNISDTDLKIIFLMIHTILMTLVKTRLYLLVVNCTYLSHFSYFKEKVQVVQPTNNLQEPLSFIGSFLF